MLYQHSKLLIYMAGDKNISFSPQRTSLRNHLSSLWAVACKLWAYTTTMSCCFYRKFNIKLNKMCEQHRSCSTQEQDSGFSVYRASASLCSVLHPWPGVGPRWQQSRSASQEQMNQGQTLSARSPQRAIENKQLPCFLYRRQQSAKHKESLEMHTWKASIICDKGHLAHVNWVHSSKNGDIYWHTLFLPSSTKLRVKILLDIV